MPQLVAWGEITMAVAPWEPIIDLEDVRASYVGPMLIDGVSLRIMPAETVALYGRSGSGKTTLLNVVAGLHKAASGQVRVLGRDLTKLSAGATADFRRTEFGFILQSYGLFPQMTARENVTFALRLAGVARSEWRVRTEDALEAVGLNDRAQFFPAALSGGERQRIALARALAPRPKVILADEPTGALDHLSGQMMLALLTTYARDHRAGILLATHDPIVRTSVTSSYQIRRGQLIGPI